MKISAKINEIETKGKIHKESTKPKAGFLKTLTKLTSLSKSD
jgi:hypothetical protein